MEQVTARISSVEVKIAVIEAILASPAKYPDLTSEQRFEELKRAFPNDDSLFTYFDYERKALQDQLERLQDEKNLLQDEKNLLQEKELRQMGPSSDPSTKKVQVRVLYEKSTLVLSVTSHDELLGAIENKWSILKQFSYDLIKNPAKGAALDYFREADFKNLSPSDKLAVKRNSKGFSKVKEDEVLSYIRANFVSYDFIAVEDTAFPPIDERIVSKATLKAAVERIQGELEFRQKAIARDESASEYSMREFISPLLVHAVNVMIDTLQTQPPSEKLLLSCEKRVVGRMYYGPVDYVIMYDCLDIVLTEAKRKGLLRNGVLQNLLEQQSAKEFLAKVSIDGSQTGQTRKRSYDENFDKLKKVTTSGIVSDGIEWVFTQLSYDAATDRTVVKKSRTFEMKSFSFAEIESVLSRVLGIINRQLNEIRNSAPYKEFKRMRAGIATSAFVLSRESTIGREVEESLDDANKDDDEGDAEDDEDEIGVDDEHA